MAGPGVFKTFVRKNITPMRTKILSGWGYANRDNLTEGLHKVKTQHADQIVTLLKEQGILKQRFKVNNLNQIESYMLNAVDYSHVRDVFLGSTSTVENTDEIHEIIPGTAETIKSLSISVTEGYETATRGLLSDPIYPSGFTTAILYGTISAAGIAATVLGASLFHIPVDVSAPVLIGTGMVYSIISTILVKGGVNPHSRIGKLIDVGSRIRELAIVWAVTFGAFQIFSQGHGLFVDAVSRVIGPEGLFFGITATLGFTVIKILTDIARAKDKMNSAFHPLSHRYLAKNITMANIKVATGLNYLIYRTLSTLTVGIGALIMNVHNAPDPFLLSAGIGGGMLLRFAISKSIREKISETVSNLTSSIGYSGVFFRGIGRLVKFAVSKKYRDEVKDPFTGLQPAKSPITKMITGYLADLAIKYGPLVTLALMFSQSPSKMFCDLATLYFGGLTLFADFLSQAHGIGSAFNLLRATFNTEDLLISDADRNGIHNSCNREVAYIDERMRNFSKIVNMLVMHHPETQVNYCGERNPYESLARVKELRTATPTIKLAEKWRDEMRNMFQLVYRDILDIKSKSHKKEIQKSALDLADVFTSLGRLYYDESDPKSYIRQLKDLVDNDANKSKDEKWFDLKGEESYVRQCYDSIILRGHYFLEMARKLREMVQYESITLDELNAICKKMLDVFYVDMNHYVRKMGWSDDKVATKTFNLASNESHFGDTLYMVWRLESGIDGEPSLEAEYVPSTYVRINNPRYNHMSGERKENMRYIWVNRNDFLEVLGVSESTSNRMKLVNNAPDNVSEITENIHLSIAGHDLWVSGFYCNDESLSPKELVDWNHHEVPRDNKMTWIAGEVAQQDFINEFKKWGRFVYGEEYDKWLATQPEGTLWFVDKPQVKVIAPAEYYNVLDEGYIGLNVENGLMAELQHTAKKDKILKHVAYEEWKAKFPYAGYSADPRFSRPIEKVRIIDREDAEIGIRYKTAEGEEIEIPYTENRLLFVRYRADVKKEFGNDGWKQVSYGLIKHDKDGKEYIEVFSKSNRSIGIVGTQCEWPHHMHPSADISTVEVIENGTKVKYPRIGIDVFPEIIGRRTWVKYDFGDNYGEEKYNKYRFMRLTDKEAKMQYWPDQVKSLKLTADGKKVEIVTLAINCKRLPVNKALAGIKNGSDAEVVEVSASGCSYIDPVNYTWSPRRDSDHTEAAKRILVIRDKNGSDSETVMRLSGLPLSLSDPKDARNVVRVEKDRGGDELVFTKLRRNSMWKDDPTFIYTLSDNLYGIDKTVVNPEYKKLEFILDRQDLTVRFTPGKPYAELFDEDGVNVGINLNLEDLLDNNKFVTPKSFRGVGVSGKKVCMDLYAAGIIAENGELKTNFSGVRDKFNLSVKYSKDEGKDRIIKDKIFNVLKKVRLGSGFLKAKKFSMGSLSCFYQSADNTYNGTEEFRPRLIKDEGTIRLILTRVKKIVVKKNKNNQDVFDRISGMNDPDMFYAVPTSGMKIEKTDGEIKWVPLSLTSPIRTDMQTQNIGTIEIKVKSGDGAKQTLYVHGVPVSKNLPDGTAIIKKEGERYFGYTYESVCMENEFNDTVSREKKIGEVSPEISSLLNEEIRKELKKDGFNEKNIEDVKVDVFYPRDDEILDGEWGMAVHGQRQHGTQFAPETFAPAEKAQGRDSLFYGVPRQKYSESAPVEPRTYGIQRGKTMNWDRNGMYSSKPIENGTPCVDMHKHLEEVSATILGLPKNFLFALSPMLDRADGWEKASHKDHYKKLCLYCRPKGWSNGVSEDEQGALALLLALGVDLKYSLNTYAFESQPNTVSQVNGQDGRRYNTAMQLSADVVIPYGIREVQNFIAGKGTSETAKRLLEYFLFHTWYRWPVGETIRKFSPGIYFASGGKIKPYVVDPYFLVSCLADFVVDIMMNSEIRGTLGYTKLQSEGGLLHSKGYGPLKWTMWKGPVMDQALYYPALWGYYRLFTEQWQYGPFVVTAEQKKGGVPVQYGRFIKMIMAAQILTLAYGIYRSLPMTILDTQAGELPDTDLGYLFNEVWNAYSIGIHAGSLGYLKDCQISNPENDAKDPKAIIFNQKRADAVSAINNNFAKYARDYEEAYRLANEGKVEGARLILNSIILRARADKKENLDRTPDMNFVYAAEELLNKLGG